MVLFDAPITRTCELRKQLAKFPEVLKLRAPGWSPKSICRLVPIRYTIWSGWKRVSVVLGSGVGVMVGVGASVNLMNSVSLDVQASAAMIIAMSVSQSARDGERWLL